MKMKMKEKWDMKHSNNQMNKAIEMRQTTKK